ncbi:MAG: hypothetical protein L3J71_14590 [Victivallaceae bacterium]|nr:hypothetical protein [Victivallaceae bacterium]
MKSVALIVALVIIGLLLISAVSFVANSILDKRALLNAANSAVARSLARSTVTRVLSMLEEYDVGNLHSTSPDKLVDMIDRLNTKDFFIWDSTLYGNLTWELVKSQDQNDNRIIGRVAYVVSPGSGIDPAACVAPGQNEGLYPEKRLGASMADINLRSLGPLLIDQTLGLKLSYSDVAGGKLPITAILPGAWVDYDTLFARVAPVGAAQVNLMKNCFIIDPPKDRELFWLDKDNNPINSEATELFNRFNLNKSQVAWNNMSLATLLSDAKLHDDKSPNAGGLPWLAYFGKYWDGKTFVDDESQKGTFPNVATRRLQIAANLKDYCDNDADAKGVIPSVPVPTTDVDPAEWNNINKNGPTYTGNERLPILNEISGYIKVVPKKHAHEMWVCTDGAISAEIINLYGVPFTKETKVTVYGTYQFSIQFKQQKDKVWQSSSQKGSFKKVIDLSDTNISWTADNATAIYDTVGNGKKKDEITISANGYKMSWADASVDFLDYNETKFKMDPGNGFSSVKIYDAKMTIARAVLEYGGKNIDLMIFDRTPPFNNGGLTVNWKDVLMEEHLENSWGPSYMFACAVAIDPRQNLNLGDWLATAPVIIGSPGHATQKQDIAVAYAESGGSAAMPNCVGKWHIAEKNRLNPYGSYLADPGSVDYESYGDTDSDGYDNGIYNPANISTNLVRNAPIKSPWEIGFIHRGAAWQTINLSKFDTKHAVSYYDGFTVGKYTTGDGNILDQIKMNRDLSNPKKINVRVYNERVFTALFDRIKLNSSRYDLAGTVSGSNLSNIPVAVSALNSFIPSLTTRASIINAGLNEAVGSPCTLSSGVLGYQKNDAAREEIIGKIVNLVEAGKKTEYFKLLVLAQAINDVGGSNGNSIKLTKLFKDKSRYLFDAKLGQFDVAVKTVDGEDDTIYADEIVAEQKISVLVHRNQVTGKCSVISIKFVN